MWRSLDLFFFFREEEVLILITHFITSIIKPRKLIKIHHQTHKKILGLGFWILGVGVGILNVKYLGLGFWILERKKINIDFFIYLDFRECMCLWVSRRPVIEMKKEEKLSWCLFIKVVFGYVWWSSWKITKIMKIGMEEE